MKKEYKINVDARILELLGPNLYTNIYYVLAELIANAYDADAKNVYVSINDDLIMVEDDGYGMSYKDGEVSNFLSVAKESRLTSEDSKTKNGRYKMGRKGVGKLAALSISEDVEIMTITENGEKSGFILNRKIPEGGLLSEIKEDDIQFSYITSSGTSIKMKDPHYKTHKSLNVIKKNIQRTFPLINGEFRIHLIKKNESILIDSFDKDIVSELAGLITLGEEFNYLNELFITDYDSHISDLNFNIPEETIPIQMFNKVSQCFEEYPMNINGWIGVYKTTRNRKKDATDFPDNFISIFANGKLGEFNILPSIGQNKLSEVYIVSQLHVDLFEETTLDDMALSNRQGYKTDDLRYIKFVEYVRGSLLPKALDLRNLYADLSRASKNKKRLEKQKSNEIEFRKNVEEFKNKLVDDLLTGSTNSKMDKEMLEEDINKNMPLLGLKPRIDSLKREILISHTKKDKIFADLIYDFLVFNGVPADKIIYTNCDEEISRIPIGDNGQYGIYDYLRDFFVDSVSTKKPFVIFVTSDNMAKSWGAIVEVGAAWITKSGHKVFNVLDLDTSIDYIPSKPLDIDSPYNLTKISYSEKNIYFDTLNLDDFSAKIEFIVNKLGYKSKNRTTNTNFLTNRIIFKND